MEDSKGVFLATLKSKPTKAGGTMYEGSIGKMIKILAFHKKDGTGIVIRMENTPMPGAQPNPAAHPYSPQNQQQAAPTQRAKPRITPRPQGPVQPTYGATFPPLPPVSSEDPPEGMWDEDWGQE